ncbi:MAG: imidazole glycerol phosphate synthase subunit HisH [Clostridiales bacterium]|nr:imidazole glycerol phosphate synthase subunit HisH [Clostridiales bacterium]
MNLLIDYGTGNLHSVKAAFQRIGIPLTLSNNPDEIETADFVILPGVGAFGDAMDRLNQSGIASALKKRFEYSRPLLGICLGMQLLFESSDEAPGISGLGLIKGHFKKLTPRPDAPKIPHMGSNTLDLANDNVLNYSGNWAYFVHSYALTYTEPGVVLFTTHYGEAIPAVVRKNSAAGFQFHPEKSGQSGETMLKTMITQLFEGGLNGIISSD